VFELADGDIRDYLRMSEAFDLAMILRTLHNTAVGLKQLHSEGIAHQDLKPSNVLIFNVLHVAKIADVGRATKRGRNAPHEDVEVPGALAYAPPELLYGYIDPDWNKRRLGCDLYLLGSLVFFLFTNVSMTAAILSKLHPMHRHNNWTDTYEHVLPYIRDAFNSTIEELEQCLPISIRMEISQITRQLCEPKPEKRGHPKEKIGTANRYSLQRYISRFDVLASKAEARLLGD
jgi:serine/threonine protein kinase